MYKNNVRKMTIIETILVKMFGEYSFDVVYPPDDVGDFEYSYYYKLFGKKTILGNEWRDSK